MISAGFDIGTRFVKVCIVDDATLLGYAVREADKDMGKLIKTIFKEALEKSGVKKRHIQQIVATGYGSNMVRFADATLPEAPCIARAVNSIKSDVRVVVDVGGLFINVVAIDDNGFLDGSLTNEKCAAGSGKFLEMVSETIAVPFNSISDFALQSNNPYTINSICAVFAESEIISQVNMGMGSSDIVAGVLKSIATRAVTLLDKIDIQGDIALCGGVSKVAAFRVILQQLIKRDVVVLPVDHQIIAAYGAAILAEGKGKWSFIRKTQISRSVS